VTAPWTVLKAFVKRYGHRTVPLRMVILGSNTAYIAKTNTMAYGASKAAVNHMVACASRELVPLGYRITVVNFGPVSGTEMDTRTRQELVAQRGWTDAQYDHEVTKNIPLKRFITRQEVAEIVYFLLDNPAAEWFTGRPVNCDSGQQQG